MPGKYLIGLESWSRKIGAPSTLLVRKSFRVVESGRAVKLSADSAFGRSLNFEINILISLFNQ
jgi:hypothetical protein